MNIRRRKKEYDFVLIRKPKIKMGILEVDILWTPFVLPFSSVCIQPCFFLLPSSPTCILTSFYHLSVTASDLSHECGMWHHRCQQLFTAGRAMLALDFPPLKREKKQTLLTHPPSFLQLQIKLTSWLDSGRGDFVLSQIIFLFFATIFSSCHFLHVCFWQLKLFLLYIPVSAFNS